MMYAMIKYYKTVVCMTVLMLATVCVYANCCNEKAKKAVFDGIELPDFADVSMEMHNRLIFNGTCIATTCPVKLHISTNPKSLANTEPKRQNAPTCTQFALSVPTISEAVRGRRLAAESQQSDLDSSFVDDGKNHCDGEKIRNASLLLLDGLLYLTLGVLFGDNDNNGIYDLFEQEKTF